MLRLVYPPVASGKEQIEFGKDPTRVCDGYKTSWDDTSLDYSMSDVYNFRLAGKLH